MSYAKSPHNTDGMPPGIPFIVSNEAAERFSFYGMRTILAVFMTKYLMNAQGSLDVMNEAEASSWVHAFNSAVYFFPILGALISDWLWGKYKTILIFSLIYCVGHFSLAANETRIGLLMGLGLIAFGAGGIKPCVSAHVGDQFGKRNEWLLEKVFGWFYLSINLGGAVSSFMTPLLLEKFGPAVAFGVPGVLMFLATWLFWLGRNRFVHIPPAGNQFIKQMFSPEGMAVIFRLLLLYVFVAMFWALFDQTASRWVLQAERMDRNLFGVELLSSQLQVINPVLIIILVPLFNGFGLGRFRFQGFYHWIDSVFKLTPLRKIGIGFFITVFAFLVPTYAEYLLEQGQTVSIGWQVLAYAFMTTAEVFVSITCLEFSYTQAPPQMKSVVMAVFYLSVSIGNLFTSFVNYFIQNPDGSSDLTSVQYYLFFSACMLLTAIVFIPIASKYKVQRYIQA